MKLGLFLMPSHPPERSPFEAQQWDLHCLKLADKYALAEAWIGEHFTAPWEPVPSPDILIAQALLQTKNIKLGTGAHLLPFHHPVELACRVAYLDHLAQGRYMFGIGSGGLQSDHELFGVDMENGEHRERTRESLDIILNLWEHVNGPFKYKGKFWDVNIPDPKDYEYAGLRTHITPYQKPHPPIMLPGVVSRDSVIWAARQRIPYIMLATQLEPTRQSFEVYKETAREEGYEAGSQNFGYLWKVHVDETEELAEEVARKFVQGPSNPFNAGNEGTANPALNKLPGMTSRKRVLPTMKVATANRGGQLSRSFEDQVDDHTIIFGTPKTVIPKIRHVLEYLRPGSVFFWDGDGAMTHDDQMRSLRLMGEEVLPAVREIADELELPSSFEVDPKTGKKFEETEAETPDEIAATPGD